MKNQKKTNNKEQLDKIFIYILLGCIILAIILSIILYFDGIKKILPIILVFILGITSALLILLLSKDILSMKKNREKQVAKKINV